MKKSISTLLILVLAAVTSFGMQDAQWIRRSCISPDGRTIAFSWQGDIFTVPSTGGEARQITSNPGYDSHPMWSSDSGSIVFSSDREGSTDIWVIAAGGGTPRRLTTYTGSEIPVCAGPDGMVYFISNIQVDASYADFPGDEQLYAVPLSGGSPRQVFSLPVGALSVNREGLLLYEDNKGYEDPFRKHHTSSVTRDIWSCDLSSGEFRRLTGFNGEDRNPVFAEDGRSFYYLSEQGGTFNVWKSDFSPSASQVQLTFMQRHPVRHLSASREGTLLFSYDGSLYTFREGGEPAKVEISISKDKLDKEKVWRNISSGAREVCPSPDGRELAMVVRGDIFVTSIEPSVTRRITSTAAQERNVSFSKDGRTLYYASERDGEWGIWKTELADKDDKYFSLSYSFREERFTLKGQTCFQPRVSPDGKWVAFLRDRTELVIKNVKDGKERSLLKGANYSYRDGDLDFEWSPDSRSILTDYQAEGGWNNPDVALIDIESGEVANLTQSGYGDSSFRWALGGKAMTWKTDKNGYRSHGSWGSESDVCIMFFDDAAYADFVKSKLQKDVEKMLKPEPGKGRKGGEGEKKDSTEKKKPEKVKLELGRREDRIVRLTSNSGRMGDQILSPDGKKLYFVQRLEKGYDLCLLDLEKRSVRVVKKDASGSFYPTRDGKAFFIVGGSGISKVDMKAGTVKAVSFKDSYEYDPWAEREYIFNHVWKQVSEKFYDPGIHGLDWEGLREDYAKFLPYIDNNHDFRDLLSEMLGELNASHTGARYRPFPSTPGTGHIGVLFDMSYGGKGLKIKEILPGSMMYSALPSIKEGDLILEINGEKIAEGTMWYDAFFRTAGKRTQLTVKHGGGTQKVFVTPSSSDNSRLYLRWVRSKEEMVQRLSGGRVGYVHVKGMNSESFREVYSRALGKYRNCEALIVDTRHNGGGWLHDDLVTFLGGKAYLEFSPRGQYIGTEPYSKWTKPSCVLMGEDNYSDACGFPYAYRALGLGKLIGAPVPGTMTAVWWETQIDPTLVFGIPQVGSFGLKEQRYLENFQIEPDILVYNDPASVLKGGDRQLEAAVEEMLREISK